MTTILSARRRRSAVVTAVLLGAASPAAIAQTVPSDVTLSDSSNVKGTVTTGGLAPVFIDGRNETRVNLLAKSTIIDWNGFNIPDKGKIDFNNLVPLTDVAVLNRDMSGKTSNLLGQLTSDRSVSVWVYNPKGILVGSKAAFNTGSLVLTTLNVNEDDFKASAGTIRLNGDAGSKALISVAGGADITVTGNQRGLVLVAPQIDANGSFEARGGSVAFVTASDVTLNYANGSPLSVTLNRGTAVSGRSQYVRGSVAGADVMFALASQATITDALLGVNADVTTATAGTRGIVLSAGRSAGTVTIGGVAADTGGVAALAVGGELKTASGGDIVAGASGAAAFNDALTARDVTLAAGGALAVANNVTASRNLDVSGSGVTLGRSATVVQSAGGTLAVRSTDGDIVGLGALTLRSGDRGTDSLLLSTAGTLAGDIRLSSGSRIVAGPDRRGTLTLRVRDAANAVTLGGVSAGALRGAVSTDAAAPGLRLASAFTASDLDVRGAIGIYAASIATGAVTSDGDIALTASSGALTLRDVTSGGDVRLGTTSGAIVAGAIAADGGVSAASGDALTLASVTAERDIALTSTGVTRVSGNIASDRAVTATAGGTLTLAAVGGATGVTLNSTGAATVTGTIRSNGTITATSGDALRLAGVSARDGVTLTSTGATQVSGAIDTRGAVAANAGTMLTLAAVTGDKGVALTSGAAMAVTGAIRSGDAVVATSGAALTLASVTATGDVALTGTGSTRVSGAIATDGSVAVDSGDTLTLASITGGKDVTLVGTGATVVSGPLGAGRAVAVTSQGTLTLGGITAGTGVTLDGAGSVEVGGLIDSRGGVTAKAGGALTLANVTARDAVALTGIGGARAGAIRSGGGVTVDAGGALTLASVTSSGSTVLTSGGTAEVTGLIDSGGALNAKAGGALTLANLVAVGDVTLSSVSATQVGTIASNGAIDVNAGTTLRLSGITSGTNVSLTGGGAGQVTGTITASGNVIANAGGPLTLAGVTTPGSVTVTSGALASMTGAVDAGGDYHVSGAAIDLGGGGITQRAGGSIRLTALGGDIRGASSLTLVSGGAAGSSLILDAAGGIALAGTNVRAGAVPLGIRAGAGSTIRLGNVTAAAIGGFDGTTVTDSIVHSGTFAAGDLTVGRLSVALASGDLTAGRIVSSGGVSLSAAAGSVGTGEITAAALDARASGALTMGAVSATGAVTLDGGSIASPSASGATLSIRTSGSLTGPGGGRANLRTTGGDLTLDAGSARIGTVSSAGTLNLLGGRIDAGSLSAAGGLTVGVGESFVTGDATVGGDLSLKSAGALSAGTLTAGGDVVLDGVSITLAGATGRSLAIRTAGTLGGGGALRTTGGDLTIDAAQAQVGDLTSAAGLTLRGGRIDAGRLAATGALTVDVRESFATGDANIGGDLSLKSAGALTAGTLTAGGDAVLEGTSITLAGAAGRSLAIRTDGMLGGGGVLRTTGGNLTIDAAQAQIGDLTSAAGLTLRGGRIEAGRLAATGALTVDVRESFATGDASIGGDLSLKSAGALKAGTLTAGGDAVLEGASITLTGATGRSLAIQTGGTLGGGGVLRTTGGNLTIDAAQAQVGDLTSAADLTLRGGRIEAGRLKSTGALSVDVRESFATGDANIGGDLSLKSAGALTAGTLTAGGDAVLGGASITLGGATGRSLEIRTGGTLGAGGVLRTTGGNLTIDAGVAKIGDVASAADFAVRAGRIEAGRLTAGSSIVAEVRESFASGDASAGGNLSLTAPGAITAGTLTAGGNAVLEGGSITLAGTTGRSLSIRTAGTLDGSAVLRTTGGDLTVDAAQARVGDVTSAAALTLRGGRIDAGRLTAAGGLAVDVRDRFAGGDAAAGGSVSLKSAGLLSTGTLSGETVNVSAADVHLGATTARNTLTVTSGGGLSLAGGTAANGITLDATGTASVGSLAGGPTIMITAADAEVSGAVRASTVTFATKVPATTALRVGDGTQANGFRLSGAELAQVAADTLRLDAGTGKLEVGTVALAAGAGRTVEMLSTGDVEVTGAVSSMLDGRSLRLGGDRAGGQAATIHVVPTSAAGGRLLLANSDVELRGDRIAVGLAPGFIETLLPGDAGRVQARALIGDPNSSLYNPLLSGNAYAPDAMTTLAVRSLTLRFADYALFQNTGIAGTTSGLVLGGAVPNAVYPALRVQTTGSSANATLALFGSINGLTGSGAALAGAAAVDIDGGLLPNARINGCLSGSLAGCLTTIAIQPTLQVFDWDSQAVFGIAQDVSVPFAPIVAGNNEELLSDLPELFPADARLAGADAPPVIALPPPPIIAVEPRR